MKQVSISILPILITIFAIFMMSGCTEQPYQDAVWYDTYSDIPGITEDLIQAIEQLTESHEYFIYGMLRNDEAFLSLDGEVIGLTAEICDWLTQLFGIPFIPRIFEELPDLMTAIEHGYVHFTGQLPSEVAYYLGFAATDPISKRAVATARVHGSRPLTDIDRERPLQLAFIAGSVIDMVLTEMGVFNEFVAFHAETVEEVSMLLLSGEADAFFCDGVLALSVDFPDFAVEPFYPFIFGYAAFAAQDFELSPIVQAVQLVLENGGMSILADLYTRGKHNVNLYIMSLLLTDEETEFIAANPLIPIAAHGMSYPISFHSDWEDTYQGIAHDILREIEAITGLEFEIINPDSPFMSTVERMLRDGDAYIAAATFRQGDTHNDTFLLSSRFFTDNYALLSYGDTPIIGVSELFYKRVALVGEGIYDEMFHTMFPNHLNTLRFDFKDDVLQALEDGTADLAFSSMRGLYRARNLLERPAYRANMTFPEYYHVSFAINENMPQLASIIDKALTIVDTQAISDYWMGRTFDFTVRVLLAQRPWLIGSMLLLVCVFILTLSLLHVRGAATRRMKIMLNSSPHFCTIFDIEANVKDANQSTIKTFGLTNIQEYKDKFWSLIPAYQPDGTLSSDKIRNDFAKVISDGEYYNPDWAMNTIDGDPIFLAVSLVRSNMEGSDVVICHAKDLRMEKEMLSSIEKALDREKAASQVKSEFLSIMSHEVRTPLNAIIGMSAIAKNEADTFRRNQCLDKVNDSAYHLLGIIDDVLDMSSIEANRLELNHAEFDIRKLLDKSSSLIEFPMAKKQHSFSVTMDDHMPLFYIGDEQRLAQVITNLLSNAINYTPEGGKISLDVSLIKDEGGFCELCFKVTDSGIGISAEEQDRVFQMFERIDNSASSEHRGMGLGLAISKRLVELMGGKITVHSKSGEGSSFDFIVKLQKANHTSPPLRDA